MSFKVITALNNDMALTNNAFFNPAQKFKSKYVEIKGFVFVAGYDAAVPDSCVALNSAQRRTCSVTNNDLVPIVPWNPPLNDSVLAEVTLDFDFASKVSKGQVPVIKSEELSAAIKRSFVGMVLTVNQKLTADFQGYTLELRVTEVATADLEAIAQGQASGGDSKEKKSGEAAIRGILEKITEVSFTCSSKAAKIEGEKKSNNATKALFKKDFNFSDLGIGGLDAEFAVIFRRAFASRIFSSSIVQKLGIQHVRGMLLYGPPGTGKTMIARKIGKMLDAKEPKIVNGPEILNKYVGASEENIRNLFADAEKEYKERGDDSDLHIIIFDEIDAICKQRGTTGGGTGVGDTVVNQLLSKMDGVDSLNNILVIGMTNRKDMIDEALLRPGRLEVHMEIGLPDEAGRLQILKIHTKKMKEGGFLSPDVDLSLIAKEIKNFSGADIDGLCKAATSFAFGRQVDLNNIKSAVKEAEIKVTMEDFERAREEVGSTFAVNAEEFESRAPGGIIAYGPDFAKLQTAARKLVELVRSSDRSPVLSFVLEGASGTGKTALAAALAQESGFPYLKFVTAEQFVGATESFKCNKIAKAFEDAYKTPLSCIVLDDIERLLEYVPMGQRFSNVILQTILVSLKRVPPKNRKILIIGTTSSYDVLEQMELGKAFAAVFHVPQISAISEVKTVLKELRAFPKEDLDDAAACVTSKIGIKKLLTVVELAKVGTTGKANVASFSEALSTLDC